MARISGIDLQDNWKVDYALTKIRGLGWSLSGNIMEAAKIDSKKRVSELSADEISKIQAEIEKYEVEGDLLRQTRANVQRLQVIGSYRGVRHSRNLPVHGQRTRTNGRTKRGKRKTVGAFKKEMLAQKAQAANTATKK
jgi:small subunit ribosomal protein S13